MRKIFKALTILSAVLACGTSVASAASTRTVNPHLISARAGWVGQVDATTLAYGARTAGSGIEVLADGTGTPRAVAAPDGCSGAAAGSGHLLFACERGYSPASDARRAVVTAVDGTVQASLDYSLQNARRRTATRRASRAPSAASGSITRPTACTATAGPWTSTGTPVRSGSRTSAR